MNRSYGRGVIAVTVAVVTILILLAYLQYTWLGRLSEEEAVRMQGTLRVAAFDCNMTFSRQMTALMKALGGPLEGSDAEVRAEVHTRVHRWQMTGSAPTMIADSTWIAATPPAEAAVRAQLDERSSILLLKDLSAVALPLKGSPDRSIHIALRRSSIAGESIPTLLHQASSLTQDCDIAILDGHSRPLFVTPGADLRALTDRPDVIAPLLSLPPAPLSLVDLNDPPGRGGDADEMRKGAERRFPPRGGLADVRSGRPGGPPFDPRSGRPGVFELRLLHRSGSLEELVTSNRIRNLGISFGVLLLLGGSVVFLILSAGRAQQLARQQLDFVAAVSHELRTPLAVLKSAGENIADGVISDSERLRQYGTLIKEEVVRLADMVERTLAFAGIQSGKQVYDAQPVDVGALVDQAVRETRKRAPHDDLSVSVSLPPDLPPVVGDLHALQSALENLLVNALKYSPGPKWVGISGSPVQRNGRSFVELKIIDRGMGIPPADVDRIFEPFYRGRNAMDGQVRGSGLGLSITKHAIEAHGGSIAVKSAMNNGSVFTLLLPAASPSENDP